MPPLWDAACRSPIFFGYADTTVAAVRAADAEVGRS